MNQDKKRNPNVWVPSLYFTQGYPLTTVVFMATVFFKSIGTSLEALGIFQGIFALPWAFKFIWSPLVELFSTKRKWLLAIQFLLAATFVILAIIVFYPFVDKNISLELMMVNLGDNRAKAAFTIGMFLLLFSVGFGMDKARRIETRVFCIVIAASVVAFWFYFPNIYDATLFKVEALDISIKVWFVFLSMAAIALLSATHDIAIDGYYLDVLDSKGQAAYSGVRVMAYRVAMVFGSGLLVMVAGKTNWIVAFGLGAAVFVLFYLFHTFYLPVPEVPVAAPGAEKKSFSGAFTSYLNQNRIVFILLFIIFFRIDDAFWKPMSQPFLMDIGVSVAQMGFLNGVLGLGATIVGTIAGGIYVSRAGLTKSLWVLGIWQSTNLLLYAWLAYMHPVLAEGETLSTIGLYHVAIINILENLAIGLGTIAFVNFLMRTCKKEYTAAHYAIATGLMALSGMLANFFSGFLATDMGYMNYFVFCFIAALPGLAILAFLPLKELEARE